MPPPEWLPFQQRPWLPPPAAGLAGVGLTWRSRQAVCGQMLFRTNQMEGVGTGGCFLANGPAVSFGQMAFRAARDRLEPGSALTSSQGESATNCPRSLKKIT